MKILKTKLQLMCLLMTTLLPWTAQGEVWFLPALDSAKQELWVYNPSGSVREAWVSPAHLDANTDDEIGLELGPWEKKRIEVSKFESSPYLQVKSRAGENLSVFLQTENGPVAVPEGRSSKRGLHLDEAEAVFVTNLSPISQDGMILVQHRSGGFWRQAFQLKGFESVKISLPATALQRIEVSGEMNLMATAVSAQGTHLLKVMKDERLPASTAGVRFLLTNPDKTQSFVVELHDPTMIREARAQISSPHDFRARILFAELGPGHNGTNQDLKNWAQGKWSWHVARALQFGELASQACDGSPEFIESFLTAWLKSGSLICFWSYKITEELK